MSVSRLGEEIAVDVTILGPAEIDFDEIVSLQRTAFAQIVSAKQADHIQTPSYYKWKYKPPAGEAKIAIIRERGRIASMNAMFPMMLRWAEGTVLGWQSCDTATDPSARGKGYFLRCLRALKSVLQEGEIFFGFPNKNSANGFRKLKWEEISHLRVFVRFIPSFTAADSIVPLAVFDGSLSNVCQCVFCAGQVLVDRSTEYLNWRYFAHPNNKYFAFSYRKNGQDRGILVLRKAEIFSREVTVIMELFGLTSAIERELMRFAAKWARQQGHSFCLMINNTISREQAFLAGYLDTPQFLQPRQLILMGAPEGSSARAAFGQTWRVHFGDWDAF